MSRKGGWKALSVPEKRSRACLTWVEEEGTGIDSAGAANKWRTSNYRTLNLVKESQCSERKKGV